MSNVLTQNPLKIDTTFSNGVITPGRIKGFKFVSTGATATVTVIDHVTGVVVYENRISSSGNAAPFDAVEIENPNPLDVTISNGVLYIYLDSGVR